jgi:hypothetical protein
MKKAEREMYEAVKCSRCKHEIEEGKEEYCWFCFKYLCYSCWDAVSHCGHFEAELVNGVGCNATLLRN